MSDLRVWLDSIGLGQYADVLATHDVDFDVLVDLNEHDLQNLGLSFGHRRKLRKALSTLQTAPVAPQRTDQLNPFSLNAQGGAERRHLTVLFCDLVDSTALATRLDPEEMRIVLREFQRCCVDAIRRHDGQIVRFLGDGVLAYFGFPVAHEDDAEHSINAALELVEAVSALAVPHVDHLQVRIGVASGLVVVGDLIGEGSAREFAIVGEAPNLAARLQALADPNQILVAPQTRRLVARLFDFADLGDHCIKGFVREVRVWRVLGSSPLTSRFEARHSSQLTRLVGRDSELAELQGHYERTKEGSGRIVLISGESGIGKSRLIIALQQRLPAGEYGLIQLQCSPRHTSSAWYPVIRHLESASGTARDDSPAQRLEKLEIFIRQHMADASGAIVPPLAALMSIPTADRYDPIQLTPQQQKNRIFTALLTLLRAQSSDRPVIFVVDDLHWVDPTTFELLERIRDRAEKWPVLLILLFRTELTLPWIDRAHVVSMTVNRLDRNHIGSLVAALSNETGLSQDVIDQIVAKTDGVPLFAEEITKAVLEAGVSVAAGVAHAPPPLAVPETLHDSLMARLDRLEHMKIVAQIAAAIGRDFSIELLETVVPLTRHDVHAAIDRLMATGLVFRSGPAANQIYTFKHALVQDEAYASMLREERRALHVRIADALTTKFAGTNEAVPELVAHHFAQAGQTEPAINQWLIAGRQATKRSAFVEAATQFRAALSLLVDLPAILDRDRLELRIQYALGNALNVVKGFGATETGAAYRRALDLCNLVDSSQTVEVLNGMIGYHLQRGEFEQSRDLALNLLARAEQLEDTTPKLMGHRLLGVSLFLIGELGAAREQLQQSLALYDLDKHGPLALVFSHDFRATALAHVALSSLLLGETNVALAFGQEALEHAERLRHPHSICYVLAFLAGVHVISGNPEAAYPIAERTISLAVEHEFPQWLAGGRMLRGWTRIELGDVERGLPELRESVDALEAVGTHVWVQFARYLLAQALVKTGETQEASERIDQLLTQIGATRGRWYEADLNRLKGDLLLACGDPVTAEICYERAIVIATRQGALLWQLRATAALGALWCSQGRQSQMAVRLAPLLANFTGEAAGSDLLRAQALLRATG